ncbi:hypothetical protein HYALB_00008860 [Hymenoscyphus albidus]|uniref:Uncharacterized protein n=1 Tax=Hymenoscyphus albidus TaxID=595503 RepID=A0A9N9Q6H3_9HELO|nr:hypothetical protein HYALB_00008860 [Hymenoscyphus albidus]
MPRKDRASDKSKQYASNDATAYPSSWSECKRDDEYRRFGRYRLVAAGRKVPSCTTQSIADLPVLPEQYEWDFEYDTASETQNLPRDQPTTESSHNYASTLQGSGSPSSYASTSQTRFSSESFPSIQPYQASPNAQSILETPSCNSTEYTYAQTSQLSDATNAMQGMTLEDEKDKSPPKMGPIFANPECIYFYIGY